ncbi:hypothetical protein K504DRAFT_538832 [Pleomassaria siparia CBS 279.74]|uniref:NPCC-domain-containing protein n=1 Tax=Pleomassaria siparia CBS 279.74 TaxID=1314801 RepID=A0A6G1JS72_9PLEO|nr:hypothetical protein K504DRAFT_538832 [Pleomassaria siparia CBS 279.74]
MSMTSRTAPASPAVRANRSTLPNPVTPAAQRQQQQHQMATPTGAWKHPKFDEITRRQYATTFDERNVRAIFFNGALLVASVLALSIKNPIIRAIASNSYVWWCIQLTRVILLANIGTAFLPLVRRYYPDDIADIPLTPSQRQSMGLDPNVAMPQTPGSAYASPNYVTPPRYQKSTPRSNFSNSDLDYATQSPMSGSPRASMANSTSNSPFSPNMGSPLFQKALGGGSTTKRSSYDSRGSPLSSSLFGDSSASNTPGTPTPGTGKASVGLNNKWLYEKRRDSRSGLFN